jgi:hypothetical protein
VPVEPSAVAVQAIDGRLAIEQPLHLGIAHASH